MAIIEVKNVSTYYLHWNPNWKILKKYFMLLNGITMNFHWVQKFLNPGPIYQYEKSNNVLE